MFKTGTPVPITLLLSENNGAQNIQHVSIYFGMGANQDAQSSKGGLVYERGIGLSKYDPNGIFKDASAATSIKNNKLEIIFYTTFAKPIETSNIAIRAWDSSRAGLSIIVPDALNVIEEKITAVKQDTGSVTTPEKTQEPTTLKPETTPQPAAEIVPEPGVDIITTEQKETIQKWAGFHTVSASDSELLIALNIKIPSDVDTTPKLPKWTKSTLGKWAINDKISMKEFHSALSYIVKKVSSNN
jgi:hypothetical protein